MKKTAAQNIAESRDKIATASASDPLAGERLDSKGRPDPNGAYAASPFFAKIGGRELRGEVDRIQHGMRYHQDLIKHYGAVETLDPRSLLGRQPLVDVGHVKRCMEPGQDAAPPPPPPRAGPADGYVGPVAMRLHGKLYIVDGTHRLAAAMLSGQTAEVLVVDVDAAMDAARPLFDAYVKSLPPRTVASFENMFPSLAVKAAAG